MQVKRLDSRVALVTGGAAGIGEATVRRFFDEGASVVVADIDDARGAALAEALGERVAFVETDIADVASFAATVENTVKLFGKLDILVNNAAVVLPSEPVQNTTEEEFDRLMGVNVRGTFFGCKAAYPHLKETRGCVVNVSSMAGVTGHPDHAAYCVSKGAINTMSKAMAVDWGAAGIRVNAVCPMSVATDALEAWKRTQGDPKAVEAQINRETLLGYCPEPVEIASVIAFLCSHDAAFVTGCVMPVSGGGECGLKL